MHINYTCTIQRIWHYFQLHASLSVTMFCWKNEVTPNKLTYLFIRQLCFTSTGHRAVTPGHGVYVVLCISTYLAQYKQPLLDPLLSLHAVQLQLLYRIITTLLKIFKGTGVFFHPTIQTILLKFWVKQQSGRKLYTTASKHLQKLLNWPYVHSIEKSSLFP